MSLRLDLRIHEQNNMIVCQMQVYAAGWGFISDFAPLGLLSALKVFSPLTVEQVELSTRDILGMQT